MNTRNKVIAGVVGGVLVACCGVGAIARGVLTGIDEGIKQNEAIQEALTANKKSHVKISRCYKDDFFTKVDLVVENSSELEQSYLITIALEDQNGTRIGEAHAALNNIKPGQKAIETAIGDDVKTDNFKCVVADVM